MKQRLELTVKSHLKDVPGDNLKERIRSALGLDVGVRFIDAYNLEEELPEDELLALANEVFADSISQQYSVAEPLFRDTWRVEVGMLPGVTDNVGKTASEAISDRLGREVKTHYSRVYSLNGPVDEIICEQIASMIHNPMVEKFRVHKPGSDVQPYLPVVRIQHEPQVEKISLHMSQKRWELMAKEKLLSLNYEEFLAIKRYFKQERTLSARKKIQFPYPL
jgi:phosphoribosylformylglycinamidine (FGAM) synthase PurS component